jgi:hypothetical protein
VALVRDPGAPVARKGFGNGPRTQPRSHRIFSLSMALSTRVNSFLTPKRPRFRTSSSQATYEQTVSERFFPSPTKTPKRAKKRRFESLYF